MMEYCSGGRSIAYSVILIWSTVLLSSATGDQDYNTTRLDVNSTIAEPVHGLDSNDTADEAIVATPNAPEVPAVIATPTPVDAAGDSIQRNTSNKQGDHLTQVPLESYKFGYDPISRVHHDNWKDTIYILHPDDVFVHSGHITAWHVYANVTAQIRFMLWRPGCADGRKSDVCLHSFQLLSSHSATVHAVGAQIISLARSDWMPFNRGDLIGMYFPDVNPIPFSKRQDCVLKTMYIQDPGDLVLCHAYAFRQKQDGWNPCRVYSVYAEIINTTIENSHECPHPSVQEEPPSSSNMDTLPDKLEVKLVNGRVPHEGLVMVRGEGMLWGTICVDGWDNADATVVCRQLGYKAGLAKYPPFFGQGSPPSSPVYLSNVHCYAIEGALRDCVTEASWKNNNCVHSEDAGVECFRDTEETTHTFGFPAIPRTYSDSWEAGVYILNLHMQFPWDSGLLTTWDFYLDRRADIALQVWRQQSANSYRLVSSTEYRNLQPGVYSRHVSDDRQIELRAGDVLGIQFGRGGNPIPYDLESPSCSYSEKQVLAMLPENKAKVKVGQDYSFTDKSLRWSGCRVYSLTALFRPQVSQLMPSTRHYSFSAGGVRYKLMLDAAMDHASARLACRTDPELGAGAGLVRLTSEQQFVHVNGILNALGVMGKEQQLWMDGHVSLQGRLPYEKWGHCEPTLGRECIVLQRTWDGENFDTDEFFMFSRSCDQKYHFICQNVTAPGVLLISNEGDEHSTDDDLTLHTEGKGSGSSMITVVVLAVIFAIIVSIVAAVFIYRKYRRHREDGDMYSGSTVRFVHLDEKAGL